MKAMRLLTFPKTAPPPAHCSCTLRLLMDPESKKTRCVSHMTLESQPCNGVLLTFNALPMMSFCLHRDVEWLDSTCFVVVTGSYSRRVAAASGSPQTPQPRHCAINPFFGAGVVLGHRCHDESAHLRCKTGFMHVLTTAHLRCKTGSMHLPPLAMRTWYQHPLYTARGTHQNAPDAQNETR